MTKDTWGWKDKFSSYIATGQGWPTYFEAQEKLKLIKPLSG
jgi:hypothetical protein